MWDEDVDLLPNKKSATKHGRRASNTHSPGSLEESKDDLSKTGRSPPEVPVRTRKTGGWADEGTKSAKPRTSNIIEQERFERSEKAQDSDDDIPVIPDIDDIQDDPLNLSDVKPNVTVKESTYKELDNQFETGPTNLGNLGDIDLTILTSKLYPEKDVQKCTEVWTMESLYQDLSKQ